MTHVRIEVLGRLAVAVDDQPVSFPPLAARVLLRLVADENKPVTVEQLHRDVWGSRAGHHLKRADRTNVQKRIGVLRKILDPQRPGEASRIIQSEGGATFAYRLVLDRGQVDFWQAIDHCRLAQTSEPASAHRLASTALALWRGEPFADVAHEPFAAEPRHLCKRVRLSLRRTLLESCIKLGYFGDARQLGQDLLADHLDDGDVLELLDKIRSTAASQRILFDNRLADSGVNVRVVVGDVFDWPDDDLVIGFTDTFDTSIEDDLIISGKSVQGQFLDRIYDKDVESLDLDLNRSLAKVKPASRETRAKKPCGKLVRYPVGTVAVLRNGRRSVFCLAYSRMGNDLVARSSVQVLQDSLAQLWRAVYRHGQFAEVTIPLVGSTLARIREADHQQLMEVIVRSFVDTTRALPVCRALRIVVLSRDVSKIDFQALATAVAAPGRADVAVAGPRIQERIEHGADLTDEPRR